MRSFDDLESQARRGVPFMATSTKHLIEATRPASL